MTKPKPMPWEAWLDRFKLSETQGRVLVAIGKAGPRLANPTLRALRRKGFAQEGQSGLIEISPVGRAALEWLALPLSKKQEGKVG